MHLTHKHTSRVKPLNPQCVLGCTGALTRTRDAGTLNPAAPFNNSRATSDKQRPPANLDHANFSSGVHRTYNREEETLKTTPSGANAPNPDKALAKLAWRR